jgi:hypothetical protein
VVHGQLWKLPAGGNPTAGPCQLPACAAMHCMKQSTSNWSFVFNARRHEAGLAGDAATVALGDCKAGKACTQMHQ